MRHFPIFLDLADRRALVIGDGPAARRKEAALREAGAGVIAASRYEAQMLDGCAVAVGADAPEMDLTALSRDAQARGIPVNVVDRPDLCSFITPAIVDRDPLTIAVGTGGAAPVLARLVRRRIEVAVPPTFGRLGALAARFRDALRARFPDLAARRRVLEEALDGRVAELVFAGQEGAAEAEFAAMIATGEAAPRGIVHLVHAGPGAPDLLTLRAHRLLGEADIIVHDRVVSDAVLALARRDAERIWVADVQGGEIEALLVRLAGEGKRVVRLRRADPLPSSRNDNELAALIAAGVAFDVVPGVREDWVQPS